MRVYLAAPLFTEAERAFNLVLARTLEAAGHDVYLPQRDTLQPKGIGRTEAIFRANLAALTRAEAVVAASVTARRSMMAPPGRSAMPTDGASRSLDYGRIRGSPNSPTSKSIS